MSLNKLIESMILNNNNNTVKFDLTKSFVSNSGSSNPHESNYYNELPISPEISTWETLENDDRRYLSKIYNFNDVDHLKYFLDSHIEKSFNINYNPEVFVKGLQIKCFLYTDDLNDITDTDIEYSKFLDDIYNDIFFIEG